MHFETREDYVAWALVMLFASSDKTNSNAIGNTFDHANKLADLVFPPEPKNNGRALPAYAKVSQPFSTPNKPPAQPGEVAKATDASGAQG